MDVVTPPKSNTGQAGNIRIKYSKGQETLHFDLGVRYSVLDGEIVVIPVTGVKFRPEIPGSSQQKVVMAKSTFQRPANILSVTSSDPDRVSFKILNMTIPTGQKKQEILEISTVPYKQQKLINTAVFGHRETRYLSNLDILLA